MDKSILDNEDASSKQPSKQEAENSIVVESKEIDVLSLPKKASEQPLPNDKPLDDEWLALSQDWQAQPYEKTDIKALLKQTKRRTLLAKSLLAIDVIATIGLIIALAVGLYQGDWGNATIAYLAFGAIGSIVFVYYEVKIRFHIWQHSCDSPDKAIDNAVSGVESSIKYIKLVKLSCWALIPAGNAYLYVMLAESEKPLLPGVLFMNAFIATMWGITHWFHLKRNKEYQQLLDLKAN